MSLRFDDGRVAGLHQTVRPKEPSFFLIPALMSFPSFFLPEAILGSIHDETVNCSKECAKTESRFAKTAK